MTLAAVFSKVSIVLAQTTDREEVIRLFNKDTCGELTDKEYSHRGINGGVIQFFESKIHRYFKSSDEMEGILRAFLPYTMLGACRQNRLMILEELYNFDHKLLCSKSHEGYNLLHALVINYNRRVLEFVTNKMEADDLADAVNGKTIYGKSPLDHAIKLKSTAAIADLRSAGAAYDMKHISTFVVADLLEYDL